MKLSMSGMNKSREATQKLQMFSKQWEPGTTLRCFYRVFRDEDTNRLEILAGGCWGHKVNDMKALGLKTTFIPSLCEYDADGNPVGRPDILNRFSRLAGYFIRGEKLHKLQEAESKDYPNETLRRTTIASIEEEYDKNNLKGRKPVIGKPFLLITTEVLVIPYVDNKPKFEAPAIVCQPISGKIAKHLEMILRNPRFAPDDDFGYLEVEWTFPMDTDKGKSGQAAMPAGVTKEYRMSEQFPEEYMKIENSLGNIADDSDMIRRRATSACDEAAIIQAFTNYSFMNSNGLQYCMDDKELTEGVMKNAPLIKELQVDRAIKDPVFTERYNEAIAEAEKDEIPVPDETGSGIITDDTAVTVDDLLAKQASAAQSQGEEFINEEERSKFMDDVDLGAFVTQ